MKGIFPESFLKVNHNPLRTAKSLVRIAGLEPARVAPLPPQSSVSANSTICATGVLHNEAILTPFRKRILPTLMQQGASQLLNTRSPEFLGGRARSPHSAAFNAWTVH